MSSIGDYNEIMSDHDLFNKVVYTPLSEAIKLLEERRKDIVLVAKIEKLLKGDIPDDFKKLKNCGVMCRQIATPNYDARNFISITQDNKLATVFYEYLDDKFCAENEFKHSLGQIRVHDRLDKKGCFIEEKISIIDFNKYNGKKLKDVKTFSGELLSDFHRKLFKIYNIDVDKITFVNGSNWVINNGKRAGEYYKNLFLLFVCHGILFENFMMNGTEGNFSIKTILPSIEKVYSLTGLKPLIVPIPPMDMEEDSHWISHEPIVKKFINF